MRENDALTERIIAGDVKAEFYEELYQRKKEEIDARKHRESILLQKTKDLGALAQTQQNRLNIVEPKLRSSRVENWVWRIGVVAAGIVILRQ